MMHRMSRWTGLCLFTLYAITVTQAAEEKKVADDKTKPQFEYRAAAGDVVFTVTDEGLSSIRVGARELAKGGWSAWNAEPWFKSSGSNK